MGEAVVSIRQGVSNQTFGQEVRAWFCAHLQGSGFEIGALNRPLPIPSSSTVRYLDKKLSSALRAQFPHLENEALVDVTVVDDAHTLPTVPASSCDFIAASHVIEHLENPIRAFRSWCRILKPGGKLYLILTDKRSSFERLRPTTLLEHLILDFHAPSEARDFEHYIEHAVHCLDLSEVTAVREALRLFKTKSEIRFHAFVPSSFINLLAWIRQEVCPLKLVEGPVVDDETAEFHVLLERAS